MSNENSIAVTGGAFSLTPKNLDEAKEIATLIAESGMVPKDYINRPGSVLVAVQMGQEVGLQPMQALQNIAVINGRPSIWGDAALALVMNHPKFVDISEVISDNGTAAQCTIKREGRSDTVRTFSVDDAIAAGLWNPPKGGPWKTHPKRMLQMRARGFAIRDSFPDAMKGLSVAEESQDIVLEQAPDGAYQAKEPTGVDEYRQWVKDARGTYAGAMNFASLKALHNQHSTEAGTKGKALGMDDATIKVAIETLAAGYAKAAEKYKPIDVETEETDQ